MSLFLNRNAAIKLIDRVLFSQSCGDRLQSNLDNSSNLQMQIDLPPELEQVVRAYVNSGKYQTAVEVLQAGVKLLQREEIADDSIAFGTLDERLQFTPLTEAEMVRESLKVLENDRFNTTPHSAVEDWVKNLGNNPST